MVARPFSVTIPGDNVTTTATFTTNLSYDVQPVVTAVQAADNSTVVQHVEAKSSAAGLITVALSAPTGVTVTINGFYWK